MSEELLRTVVAYLVRLTEAGATIVIFTGTVVCFFQYVMNGIRPSSKHSFLSIRINLGRFLALGLEFQLASDLLRTAVAPSFEEIGKLAAVAAIRTSLNYFLSKETLTTKEEVKPSESSKNFSITK